MDSFFLTVATIFALSMIVFVHVAEPPHIPQAALEMMEAN